MPTIYCIGKNYAAHVREMGDEVAAAGEPVVFLKPWSARVADGEDIRLPPGGGEIHHEAEIVVRVGPDGRADAVGLGLDLTDRTRQGEAKASGLPWASAKGFRGSAPLGPLLPAETVGPLDRLRFRLEVNGEVRQQGDTALMLRAVPALLAHLDAWFGLQAGDLVFTGTPAGVGPLHPGDRLHLALEGHPGAAATFRVLDPDAD
jgi:2-keto-4-pentenoate hydratase/2-oxohepta-3-ene-1,7-dioic acid hydratase in catechol pathway